MNERNLDQFLKSHRPDAPAARVGEAQRIWNRISAAPKASLFGETWLALTGTLAALLVLWFASRPIIDTDTFDEEAFVITTMADLYEQEEAFDEAFYP